MCTLIKNDVIWKKARVGIGILSIFLKVCWDNVVTKSSKFSSDTLLSNRTRHKRENSESYGNTFALMAWMKIHSKYTLFKTFCSCMFSQMRRELFLFCFRLISLKLPSQVQQGLFCDNFYIVDIHSFLWSLTIFFMLCSSIVNDSMFYSCRSNSTLDGRK